MRNVIFSCRRLGCSAWNKYLLHEGALPNELCQDTEHRGWSHSKTVASS